MIHLPDTQLLDVALSDGWLHITLNDVPSRNALSSALTEEFLAVLHVVRAERAVRGITLRGAGGVFCAGGDLKAFAQLRALSPDQARAESVRLSLEGAALFHAVYQAPQVVVALIEGAAVAGGLGLACAADFACATDDAQLAFSETRLGLVPAQIAPFVIAKAGRRRARRWLLTGCALDGREAAQAGLIDASVSDASGLTDFETRLRRDVLRCAPHAVAVTKHIMDEVAGVDLDAYRQRAAAYFGDCLSSAEGREGVDAFLARRAPAWDSRA